jgi:predicted peptidase
MAHKPAVAAAPAAVVVESPTPDMPKKAPAHDRQSVHQFERTLTKTAAYKYLLALPDGFDRKSERRWPLILFLHGSGERGNDVRSVARHGPPKLLEARGDGPGAEAGRLLAENFIVVSPQCPKNAWWDTEALRALLEEIIATQPVDESRVYLTGLSMGGFATWELGLADPERFAAIVPICGGGSFAPLFVSDNQKRVPLRSLGVWAFHGAKDPTVPVAESERMLAALQHFKVEDVNLTVYPAATHDSWTETYANPTLYTWLLAHQRGGTRKPKGRRPPGNPR